MNVTTPYNNMATISPARFKASATTGLFGGDQLMRIYTSGDLAISVHAASFSTTLSLSPGIYNTVVQATDNCGKMGKTYITVNVVSCSVPTGATAVHFCAPAAGASVVRPSR